MQSYRISIIDNPAEAERIWNLLSPHKTIYDEWAFRWTFFKYHPEWSLHFVVAFAEDQPVALLPLQNGVDLIEFMGGDFMEDNRVFITPGHEDVIPRLFELISSRAFLRSIIDDARSFLMELPLDFPKYYYDLQGIPSIDDCLARYFQSKSRNTLRKKIRSIESLALKITSNELQNIDLLATYNIKTFNEESSFVRDPFQAAIFKELCGVFNSFVHSFYVDGKLQAVSYSLLYKQTYLYLLSGTNKEEVSNLGNYLILKNVQTALENKCLIFDAGRHDCNWKERWHLSQTPEHQFVIP